MPHQYFLNAQPTCFMDTESIWVYWAWIAAHTLDHVKGTICLHRSATVYILYCMCLVRLRARGCFESAQLSMKSRAKGFESPRETARETTTEPKPLKAPFKPFKCEVMEWREEMECWSKTGAEMQRGREKVRRRRETTHGQEKGALPARSPRREPSSCRLPRSQTNMC